MKVSVILAALSFLMIPPVAFAEEMQDTPFVLSLFSPAQFPPEEFNNVRGLRTNILWGRHRSVSGVDLGLGGNHTLQDFTGIGIAGALNLTDGQTTIFGLQFAGFANINNGRTDVFGIQMALLNENFGNSKISGMQVGLGNFNDQSEINGLQIGLYNSAREVHGVQFGLVNFTKNLVGFQIGLVNFNSRGLFKVLPLLNFGF